METITLDKVKELLVTNHVVYPMPRKKQVRVDGYKIYNANKTVLTYLKEPKQ